MRKKLFTLMTLLLCAVTGAWASTVEDLVAISSNYTFTASEYSSGLTTATLYDSDKILSLGGSAYNNGLQIKTNRQIAFKVAGECSASFVFTEKSGRKLQIGSTSAGTQYGQSESSPLVCNITSAGVVYISASSDLYLTSFTLTFKTATSEALKSSAAVKVDDTALTLGAASDGYSVSGSTITLSDNIISAVTPTNVKLVKTITYDDSSTKEEDVDVTFNGTVTSGYYIGTASIGLTGSVTNYTVRVKQSTTPTATLSETSGTISLDKSWKIGTAEVTLTGGNLTDGTYEVTADVAGTTISPTSFTVSGGSVSQAFTITSSSSSAATTVFTFGTSGMGITAPTYTLTYSGVAKRSLSQTDVTCGTTWDWENAGSETAELSASTSPTNSEEFLMAALPEVTNDATFNSQALKVTCQFPTRGTNYYFQGNTVKFNVTVPGTVKVWFSNTSNREDKATNRRYLYINDTNTEVYTLNQTFTTGEATVAAGEVTIDAKTGEDIATMIRIQKIVFTPTLAMTEEATDFTPTALGVSKVTLTRTLSSTYYNSICLPFDVDLTDTDSPLYGADVQEFSSVDGTTLKFSAVSTTMEAGTPYLVKPTADLVNPTFESVDVKAVAAGTVTKSNASSQEFSFKGTYNKVTLKTDKTEQFLNTSGTFSYPSSDGVATMKGLRAYFIVPAAIFGIGAPGMSIVFGDESSDDITTGISAIEHSTLNIEHSEVYNLNGQRVSQPTKGLYIVNGKKVIVK